MSAITVEKRERTPGWTAAWITLNRPEAMNALSGQVLAELAAAVADLEGDKEVRAVVVTGAGDKAFCAGADLKERREMSETDTRRRIDTINDVFTRLSRLPQPTLAAINGFALGGGLELALACDFRLAVPGAQLGLTEVRLGILPGAGGTQRLPRLVGAARAKELILLGRRLTAARAAEIGLVHQVAADLAAAVDALLGELLGCAPLSVREAKQAIDGGLELDLHNALRLERACYEATLDTEDRLEGLRAFAEKRPPLYKGH